MQLITLQGVGCPSVYLDLVQYHSSLVRLLEDAWLGDLASLPASRLQAVVPNFDDCVLVAVVRFERQAVHWPRFFDARNQRIQSETPRLCDVAGDFHKRYTGWINETHLEAEKTC